MFHDKKDDQVQPSTDIDEVAQDISGTDNQHIGLGTNPTHFDPVMPQAATTAPEPPTDDTSTASSDDSTQDATVVEPIVQPTSSAISGSGDLESIKAKALEELSPLVGKLEQPPEDRFKTMMMLIQASDNHDLIKDAYQAAQEIQDETKKAEALLAIVNEINYFSQQKPIS